MLRVDELKRALPKYGSERSRGTVVGVHGPLVTARIPLAAVGDLCSIAVRGGRSIPAQVIAFTESLVKLAPFEAPEGVVPGAAVRGAGHAPRLAISAPPLGAVLDALGRPLDGSCADGASITLDLYARPPNPLERRPIRTQLVTGVRSIDGLCGLGCGQRLGLFAGAGVGKSTLLGMIARNSSAAVNVIALVGERGREVREFIDQCLGGPGLRRSVVIAATSDESSMRRTLAAYTATAVAEHYRERGLDVLLLVDSLTRLARALREVGLAAGEIPVRQGYTASVYTELPRLLERGGTSARGSITAVYTVLTHGEQEADPLGEEIKSILDGHVVLSEAAAQQGVFPAVDHALSVSRLFPALHSPQYLEQARLVKRILSRLKRDRDILLLGGTPDAELEAALKIEPRINAFLKQRPDENCPWSESRRLVEELAAEYTTALEDAPSGERL